MKCRYRIAKDYWGGLTSEQNWAVYDIPETENQDAMPIAVFAKRSDAIKFRKMKESE